MAGFKQPQNQSAPTPSVPQPAQTPQKPQSAAAIVGLVLGILAIVISWVPIVNNFAFIVGLIGLVFAIVGLTGTLRGKKRGRYADDEEASEDDIMAERIIHWAPPITAIVCALIIAVSLVYHFVIA